MALRFAPLLLLLGTAAFSEQQMAQPRFSESGELLRPEGYREWMFVGSSLGMGYTEGQARSDRPATFHNIFIQREAYREYVKTGRFPDKTTLVMEVLASGTNASINKKGQFSDRALGVEAAVKDEGRFKEKWAYFNFIGKGGKPLATAAAFPKQSCWSCHNEHGAADNVFVQFYPALRDAKAAQ